MNQSIQKNFVRMLAAAVGLMLILNIGIGRLLQIAGLPEWAVSALPWVPVALMAAIAATILAGAIGGGLVSGRNRLMNHVVGWTIAAAACFVLQYAGDWVESLFEWDTENSVLKYISEFLSALVGIFVAFGEGFGRFAGVIFAAIAVAIAGIGWASSGNERPGTIERLFVGNIVSKIAAVPMVLTTLGVFVGATLWTVVYSFTNSRLLPKFDTWDLYQKSGFFSGKTETGRNIDGVFMQYERLWGEPRWIQSIINLAIYGLCSLIFTLVIGFLLAAMLDRKIRFENAFRTIFLYPFALSFIVTGLVWQWILNPEFGIQMMVRRLGFENFTFDPLYNPDIVIYGLLIAGLWQGTGLIMCIMLAGLRGIDEDIWKATNVDGIPIWKTYTHVIIPMLKPIFITALVLITSGIVKLYDLVVAQTSGGPGIASEVPAKYVYDKMFQGQNLGQGFAASTMMLVTVAIILIPWAYLEFGGKKDG